MGEANFAVRGREAVAWMSGRFDEFRHQVTCQPSIGVTVTQSNGLNDPLLFLIISKFNEPVILA